MKVKFNQEGGTMDPAMQGGQAPEQGGMAPGGQDEMMAQIGQMAQQIIEQMGPEAAAMLAQAIMEMLQGGGQAEMPAPEEQPAFQRLGGRLVRVN